LGLRRWLTARRKKEAEHLLKAHSWNVEAAIDTFFANQQPPPVRFFDDYKDEDDTIGPEGTEKLCNDLGVDPSDVVTIVLSWHMKVDSYCHAVRACSVFVHAMRAKWLSTVPQVILYAIVSSPALKQDFST